MTRGITKTEAKAICDRTRNDPGNDSISANWTWDEAYKRGWFGFRTRGPQPVIAHSWNRKQTRWHHCDGYSS